MGERFRLGELADRIGGRVLGDAGRTIRGVAPLDRAGPQELSFLISPRFRKAAQSSRAGALLVGPGVELAGRDLLVASEPRLALAEILELFHPARPHRPGVSPDARLGREVVLGAEVEVGPFAVIGDGVRLADRVVIGAGCVIGDDCSIGEDSHLAPRVVLYADTRVGRRCQLHAGVVLGADGFGFARGRDGHRKIPQVGRVVVEDDVEIGANTTVDRAAMGETVIGRGTKIDNLVMVAHNVRIGPHGLLAAQSGVAGSARLGERVTLAGQAGVSDHLEVGDRVVVAAKSALLEDAPAGAFVAGTPAVDHRVWKRSQALARRLPVLRSAVRRLAARVDRLEARLDEEE